MCTDLVPYVIIAAITGLVIGSFAAIGALWFTTGLQGADVSQIQRGLSDENT